MMLSYSISLLKVKKLRLIACSMTSPVGALSCNPRSAPVCRETPSTFRITNQSHLAPPLVEESLLGNHPILIPSMLGMT